MPHVVLSTGNKAGTKAARVLPLLELAVQGKRLSGTSDEPRSHPKDVSSRVGGMSLKVVPPSGPP